MEENEAQMEVLRRYLNGELSREEQAAFELEMAQSPSLQETVALHQQIDRFEDEEDWPDFEGDTSAIKAHIPLFEDDSTREFSEKLKNFRANSSANNQPRVPRWAWVSGIAACLALLLFLALPGSTSMDSLYVEHSSWEELPSLNVKGDPADEAVIEQLFIQKKYTEVLSTIDQIQIDADTPVAALWLYEGVAQLELEQYENALKTFQKLSNSDLIDHHKGYWYTAMVYLKKGDKESLISTLEHISQRQDYFRNKEAKELLKELQ
ncbi:MAG: hypothetical protein AAF466_00390 [Bacteroidota bacterium]